MDESNMFPSPEKGKLTVYSKSGCPNCTKVKQMLKDKNVLFSIIDCDEFILENKTEFLLFIQQLIGREQKIFPMVFDYNVFIGGYDETNKYIDKLLEFDFPSNTSF
jgi:glutaredoxin